LLQEQKLFNEVPQKMSQMDRFPTIIGGFRGQSHEIYLALIDMTRRSRPEKCLGFVFKFVPCCTVVLFNEITGVCFLLAEEICKCVAVPCLRLLDIRCLLQPANHSEETFKGNEAPPAILQKEGGQP